MAGTPVTTPEDNLIKKDDLVWAREVEFTFMFVENLRKLMEALNITRKIPKQAGTNLKAYKAVGRNNHRKGLHAGSHHDNRQNAKRCAKRNQKTVL